MADDGAVDKEGDAAGGQGRPAPRDRSPRTLSDYSLNRGTTDAPSAPPTGPAPTGDDPPADVGDSSAAGRGSTLGPPRFSPARAADRTLGAAETAGRAAETAGRGARSVGKGAQSVGKGTKAAGRGVEFAGKAGRAGAAAADAAGTGATSAGKALQAAPTGVTNVIGAGLMAGGAVSKGGAKAGKAASHAAEKGGKGARAAGKKVEQAGKKVEQAGKKVEQAGKGVKDKARNARSRIPGVRKNPNTPRGKVRRPISSGLGKAVGAATNSRGAGKAAEVGARALYKAGKWTMALMMSGPAGAGVVGISLFLVLSMVGVSLLAPGGGGSVPSFQADENPDAVGDDTGQVSQRFLEQTKDAAENKLVPWPVIAAIGSVASDSGRINPYTGDPLQPGERIGPEDGEEGGIGPYMLSDWAVSNYGSAGNPYTIDGGAQILAAALSDWANDQIGSGLLVNDGASADKPATEDADVTDPMSADRVTVSELTRFANMDRNTVPDDRQWMDTFRFWQTAIYDLDLYEPSGNEYCFVGGGTSVSRDQKVEASFRCEASKVDDEVYVWGQREGRWLVGQDAVEVLVAEAVAVTQQMKAAGACDEYDRWSGGWFPVASSIEYHEEVSDDPATSKVETVTVTEVADGQSRCDEEWGLHRVAEGVISRAAVPPDDRKGGTFATHMYGWDWAPVAPVLGERNTYGDHGPATWSTWEPVTSAAECEDAMTDFAVAALQEPTLWPDGLMFESSVPVVAQTSSWETLATHPWFGGDANPDGNVIDRCGPVPFRDRLFSSFSSLGTYTVSVADYGYAEALRNAVQQASANVAVPPTDGFATLVDRLDLLNVLTFSDPGIAYGYVERLSNPPLDMATPSWERLSLVFERSVVNQVLFLLGEACPDASGGGTGLMTASVGTTSVAPDASHIDRARDAASAAYGAGFRGDDLYYMVAIAGAESTWDMTAINAETGAAGYWQINPKYWIDSPNSPLAQAGWTRADLLVTENNADAAYLMYSARRSNDASTRFDDWEVHTDGLVEDSHVSTATTAVDLEIDDPYTPEPDGTPPIAQGSGGTPQTTCEEAMQVLVFGDGNWTCPIGGSTSFIDDWGFPRSGGRSHEGLDMFADDGTPIVATSSGVVGSKRDSGLGGLSIRLVTDDSQQTYWFMTHMQRHEPAVRQGMYVEAGTVIGYVGTSGNAAGTPPHLHIERHPGGYKNPQPLFPIMESACVENRT